MATPDQPEKFTHSVRNLTRLSSEGDYVVVDREAPCILLSARRIKKSQSPYGVFYEAYHSIKSKVKSFFSRPSRAQSTAAAVPVAQSTDSSPPYDTTDWDDEQTDRKHYISASDVAGNIHSAISSAFPGIRGHSYILNKFKIYQTFENDNPVRDYFLQIRVDVPGMKYIFAHAKESGESGCPHIQYIKDSHYPHPAAQ